MRCVLLPLSGSPEGPLVAMAVPHFLLFFLLRQTLFIFFVCPETFLVLYVVFLSPHPVPTVISKNNKRVSGSGSVRRKSGPHLQLTVIFSASVIPFTLEWHLISHYLSSALSFDRVKLCFRPSSFFRNRVAHAVESVHHNISRIMRTTTNRAVHPR